MRAAVFDGPGRLLVLDDHRPVPEPAAGELVVRVRSTGICGTDLHLTEDPPGVPSGTVLGHEFAGDVIAVGSGVEGWRIGDRLCALPSIGCAQCRPCAADDPLGCDRLRTLGQGDLPGAYAEFVRVGAREAFRLPPPVDFDQGALVEPLSVALHAVRTAALRPTDTMLVLGAGPIGLGVTTWARHLGVRAVAVVDPLPARRSLAMRFGATVTVDPTDDATLDAFHHEAGGLPSVVVECVGRPGFLQDSVQHVRRHGRIVIVGACMAPDALMPAMACLKGVTIHFVVGYRRADFARTLTALAAREIASTDMITDRVDLPSLPAAFEALRRPGSQCKVIVHP
jgi:(R,R)-butanediol dehydrogenase/meso-butanediol dehydrogenase/diacetyl reductase